MFTYFLYKLFINLRYGVRGANNVTKMIAGVSLLIFSIFILLNLNLVSQPFYDFNYETLNPLSSGTSTDISIKNPTYNQMQQFIFSDTTDSNQYVFYEYVCVDFSRDVINNAKNNGIRAAMIYLNEPTGFSGHAIVAFQTTDRGLYFVEPQLDVIFSEGHMEDMLARGIYDIQTMYGGTYYQYTEYFNMQLTGYNIEYWNDGLLKGTPGFETVLVIGAIAVSIFLWTKKKSI